MDNRQNILGYNSNNNQFDSSEVVPNADGSVIERIEKLQVGVGETTDFAAHQTILGYLNSLYQHVHQQARVYPSLADGKVVTGGAGAWALGSFVEIIPANTITGPFDIHYINFEDASATDTYQLILYSGLGGAEIEIGAVKTKRETATSGTTNVPIQIPAQLANARISAKVASKSGGSDTVTISVYYHLYS